MSLDYSSPFSYSNSMKNGDKVYIHFHDIDACGYGDSVNCQGEIVGSANGLLTVEYKQEQYPFDLVQKDFYEHDLTLLPE